jgi:hypothetical protein
MGVLFVSDAAVRKVYGFVRCLSLHGLEIPASLKCICTAASIGELIRQFGTQVEKVHEWRFTCTVVIYLDDNHVKHRRSHIQRKGRQITRTPFGSRNCRSTQLHDHFDFVNAMSTMMSNSVYYALGSTSQWAIERHRPFPLATPLVYYPTRSHV